MKVLENPKRLYSYCLSLVIIFLDNNNDTTSFLRMKNSVRLFYLLHHELSPSIPEVKLASPPFWGSTRFVSVPFCITNANAKKKCVKVC